MSMTNPCDNWCISKGLYINLSNLCNLLIRYIFNKLVPKLTKYTSYKVGNLSKAVPNNNVFGDNLL